MTAERRRKRVGVVTVGRSDFSILHPLAAKLCGSKTLECGLIVSGAHFHAGSGATVNEVYASGLPIWARYELDERPTDISGTARTMGDMITTVGADAASLDLDLAIILGDRFEALAIGLAMFLNNIPVAHISGGCITEGAMDDVFRHSLTQIACLHFCDTQRFGERINQLGAEPDTIHVVGALGLDGIRQQQPVSWDELKSRFPAGFPETPGYWLVTLHPETKGQSGTKSMAENLLAALDKFGGPVLFTYPNADPESEIIIDLIERDCAQNPQHWVIPNLGARNYYAALTHAGGVAGNSSSGIIEAASFRLPAVDIGERQRGRFCGPNVIRTSADAQSIFDALNHAKSAEMRQLLDRLENPYGDGFSADRIASILERVLGADLPKRRFSDYIPEQVSAVDGRRA